MLNTFFNWLLNPRNFARTMISILFIGLFFIVLSLFKPTGDLAYKVLIKIIGKYDIFKGWFSILEKNINWNEISADNIRALQSIIAKPSGILNELPSNPSGSLIFAAFLAVFSKATFEAIISGSCSAIFKGIIPGWTLMCNVLGVIVGLAISSALTQTGGVYMQAIAYPLVSIVIIGIGIFTIAKRTRSYNNKEKKKISFLIDVIWGIVTALATTLYVSTLCLISIGAIQRAAVIPVSLIYIFVLTLDFFKAKARELRDKP